MSDVLVWLDLETTGLDPNQDAILEIFVKFTKPDTTSIDHCYVEALFWPTDRLHRLFQNKFWLDNSHIAVELIREAASRHYTLEEVEKMILDLMDQFEPDTKFYLAGNSIHFDRKFLKVFMPGLDQRLHYRMFDVSVLELFERFNSSETQTKTYAHRAKADVLASIESYRYYIKKYEPDLTSE